MDKIHNKACKSFDNVCKKKNKTAKNPIKDSVKGNADLIAHLSYKSCNYCHKVFVNSTFLLKHLWRRHSDELVLFYKNTSDDLQHLIVVLKEEFSSLKKELVSAKLAVHEKNKIEDQITADEDTSNYMVKRNPSINSNVSNEIGDLKQKIIDVEKDIQNLNDKFIELDNLLKYEVLMKQDATKKLSLSEEKIIQTQESQFIELRQILLNELKSLLHNEQQDISQEWKSQLLELGHEIKRLDSAIDNVKQQLKCTDSLKQEIEKELMPHIIPHVSRRKCEKKKLKHSLFNAELSANESYLTSQHQEVSSHENFDCNKSHSNSFQKVTLGTDDEIASMVAEKLSQFSIEPNVSKISCTQFNKILKFLSTEKEQYSKKYGNFFEIYNKLNMAADQKAHSKLKTKKHHKITFAEPLTSNRSNLSHSSFEGGMHTCKQSPSIEHRNKQIASTKNLMPSDSQYSQKENHRTLKTKNFTHPDKGASGDATLPILNKQNIPIKYTKLSSIRESEISDVEDIEMPKDFSGKFPKHNFIVNTEQSKYERQSSNASPIQQRKFDSPVNNHSIQHHERAAFTFPGKGDSIDPVLTFPTVKNIRLKHTKVSSVKKIETSSPVEDIEISENINIDALKPTIATTGHFKYEKQVNNNASDRKYRRLNFAVGNHAVQLKNVSEFKTVDEYGELEDYSKSEDDFDDVSSLETYKSSDDDDDHILTCS